MIFFSINWLILKVLIKFSCHNCFSFFNSFECFSAVASHNNNHFTFYKNIAYQKYVSDLSESDDSSKWNNLVYSQDEEQTTIGWENINPYPKYVEKRLVSVISN